MRVDYDWEDYKIRAMVERRHHPTETWDRSIIPTGLQITCEHCRETWPCKAQRELQAWKREDLRKHWAKSELDRLEPPEHVDTSWINGED